MDLTQLNFPLSLALFLWIQLGPNQNLVVLILINYFVSSYRRYRTHGSITLILFLVHEL